MRSHERPPPRSEADALSAVTEDELHGTKASKRSHMRVHMREWPSVCVATQQLLQDLMFTRLVQTTAALQAHEGRHAPAVLFLRYTMHVYTRMWLLLLAFVPCNSSSVTALNGSVCF